MQQQRERSSAFFVDPETGEPYADHEQIDPHGVPLIGVDGEFGVWWGTERAAWLLSHHWATVVVTGRLPGGVEWYGHFVGTAEQAVYYAESHGVIVEHVEDGEFSGDHTSAALLHARRQLEIAIARRRAKK